MGRPDATVKLVVFVDYDCPSCRKAMPELEKEAAHTKNLVVYVHQMPLRNHKLALPAATLAANAESKGIYPAVDRSLLQGGPLTDSALKKIGDQYGISSSPSDATSKLISADKEIFSGLKLNFVPRFLVVKDGYVQSYKWSDIRGKLANL